MAVKIEYREDDLPTYAMSRHDDDIRKMMGAYGFKRVAPAQAQFILFPGGADVSPFLYGEPRMNTTRVSFNQDMDDIRALRATHHGQWKIGICRGAQFLNVMVGNGRLYQHVNNHAISGVHPAWEPGVNGSCINVSSTHHQMMLPGPGASVLLSAGMATEKHTPAGVKTVKDLTKLDDAEAVLYMDEKTFCFQPHPEIPDSNNKACRDWFFEQLEVYCLTKLQMDTASLARRKRGMN